MKKDGEIPEIWKNSPGYDMHRGDLHQIFLDTAREYGADVRLGSPVERYFETEAMAGVEANGREYTADVVVGADGHSSSYPFSARETHMHASIVLGGLIADDIQVSRVGRESKC